MNDKAKVATAAATRVPVIVERTYPASAEELWSLWTTRQGFESWWGPQGFRVEVHAIDPRVGGVLRYDMIADTPEMIAAMKDMGRPRSHETRGTFTELKPMTRLAITHVIDFLPGVKPYDSTIVVEFFPAGERVRMVVTLSPMHDEEFSHMQKEGFSSQLTKLDQRFAS
jgi:uncharacterized protein YndB with AHSA1/START domain